MKPTSRTWNGPQMHLSRTGQPGGQPFCNTRQAVISTTIEGLPQEGLPGFDGVPVQQRCDKCQAIHIKRLAKYGEKVQ